MTFWLQSSYYEWSEQRHSSNYILYVKKYLIKINKYSNNSLSWNSIIWNSLIWTPFLPHPWRHNRYFACPGLAMLICLRQRWPKIIRDALCSHYATSNVTSQFPFALRNAPWHRKFRRARGNWGVTLRVAQWIDSASRFIFGHLWSMQFLDLG